MTKPEQAGLRPQLILVLMKFGIEFDPVERLNTVNAVTDDALDTILSLFESTALQVIDWGSWMTDHCDLHEKYTSACCNCQKAKYALEMNEQREDKQRQALSRLLGQSERGEV